MVRGSIGFTLVLWGVLSLLPSLAVAQADRDRRWEEACERMVREEVIGAGVTDERICAAVRKTPRHLFVPAPQRQNAYYDMALPIGGGQTISPPVVVARMTQALAPQPQDKVLEIGTGSGYQAAILGHLVKEVYSIEIVESLGRTAARTLQQLRYANVHTKVGDGFQGWPEHAPFDKIIVTCSPEKIPTPLIEQLAEGGLIVVPLGERYQQTLYRFKKVAGEMRAETLEPTFFVPMTGRAEELRERRADTGVPELVNGGFETADEHQQPVGWYYVRQAQVVKADTAPEGQSFLRFRNDTPGRNAQALQALGIDGRVVSKLAVRLSIDVRGLRPGTTAKHVPGLSVNFFDEQRNPVGIQLVGPWSETAGWTQKETTVPVPARARLATVAVGMFGAVGEVAVDDLSVRAADE